jgi:hypothetical protein
MENWKRTTQVKAKYYSKYDKVTILIILKQLIINLQFNQRKIYK